MSSTSTRKQEHLDLCKMEDVESQQRNLWDSIPLPHRAAPEIDWDQVSTQVEFLGQTFPSPFLISSMTGGSTEGEQLNALLARFAQDRRLPMGVGSQRVALENRDKNFFSLRQAAPRACLYGNIGLVQFNYGVTTDDVAWLVDQIEAQALILHLNPLQEAVQNEGTRNFAELLRHIAPLKKRLQVPVILKETGCGLDARTCARAVEAGIDALDIAGLGGTHWGFIEGLRDPSRRALGTLFRNWGIPSPQALSMARAQVGRDFPLIASGGIRNGLDAAKALWLGADFVGMALPFLKKAQEGEQALHDFLDLHEEALRIALFCTGHTTVKEWKLG